MFAGSIRARGKLDNLWFRGTAPLQDFLLRPAGDGWEVGFLSRIGWVYRLEQSPGLDSWQPTGPATNGTGEFIVLPAPASASSRNFYRVQAIRP